MYAGDKRCRSCKKTLPPGLEAELALAVDAFIIDAIRGKLPDWEITSRLKARGVEPREGGLEYWRDEVKENVEALCFELV